MAVRVVRLGTPRASGEGVRLGTVRHPPRGVRKDRYAAEDWFDLWLPELAPAAATVNMAKAARKSGRWSAYQRRYRAEMARPAAARLLDLLAALSHHTDFSVGCYCEDEEHCHRTILKDLLKQHQARLA
ncbi:MAG TPA: DUF488 family protein [Candidatus Polarisedimenticolia bacterium]|nr:DUF488 family protein [Candidatus Polarisedimenticolia bacterium]